MDKNIKNNRKIADFDEEFSEQMTLIVSPVRSSVVSLTKR